MNTNYIDGNFISLLSSALISLGVSWISNFLIQYRPLKQVKVYMRELYNTPIVSSNKAGFVGIEFILSLINLKGITYSFSNIECVILTKDNNFIYCDYLHKNNEQAQPQSVVVNAHSSSERKFYYGTTKISAEDIEKIVIVFKDYRGKDKYCVIKENDIFKYTINGFKETRIIGKKKFLIKYKSYSL